MTACKTSIGGSSTKKHSLKWKQGQEVQDINDVTTAMKCLSFSGGAFSQSVIKGYSVGTLARMDKMTLQRYVELQVLVPLSTKALNFGSHALSLRKWEGNKTLDS